MSLRLVLAALAVALVVVYAVMSGLWVESSGGWYGSLKRPSWQPPDVVFGLIWPYNFVALAVVGVIVTRRGTESQAIAWLVLLGASVAAALAWAYLFYVPHALVLAGVALAVAALLTLGLLAIAARVTPGGFVALVPYQVWLVLATSLAFGYERLNP